MKRQVATLALVAVLCATSAAAGVSEVAAGDRSQQRAALVQHAVIYARPCQVDRTHWSVEIIWQSLSTAGQPRVLYKAAPTDMVIAVPSAFGLLPSPGGRFLLVWESTWKEKGGTWLRTTWKVLSLPDGKVMSVAEVPGFRGFLPYWLDDQRLLLERGPESTVFDLRTRRFSKPLPPRIPALVTMAYRDVESDDTVARGWRHDYLQRHYARDCRSLPAVLSRLGGDLGVCAYLRARDYPEMDTEDDLLIRPLGIVDLAHLLSGKDAWPSIAFSPKGGLVARAGVLVNRPPREATGVGGFEARVDVWRVSTGEHVWGQGMSTRFAPGDDVAVTSPGHHGGFFAHPRWSPDERYFSFTTCTGLGTSGIVVLDAATWRERLQVPNALNAFVVRVPQ